MLRKKIPAALAAVMTLASFTTAFAVNESDVIPVQAEAQSVQGGEGQDDLSVAGAASKPQTAKFSYSIDGDELTVSLNGQIISNNTDEGINVFIAVY
ncbi:MAG: hypothetical protein IJH94_04030, partial [Clostridia bacterium]|nr:hypothetical protein [Clostridia bacterium]